MSDVEIDDIDRSLEIVALIRASEAGFAREGKVGVALEHDADRSRLDAFTLGLLDAMAQRIGNGRKTLRLLAYLHVALEYGPGEASRRRFHEYLGLESEPRLSRYVAGGRRHVLSVLIGDKPKVGRFVELLSEELDESSAA